MIRNELNETPVEIRAGLGQIKVKRLDSNSWGYVEGRRVITIIKRGKRHFAFSIMDGPHTVSFRESKDVDFWGARIEAIRQWRKAFDQKSHKEIHGW